jgi:hypothetical protein
MDIELPNGDKLRRRRDFARDTLDITDRTAQGLGLPTTYIGNVAYVPVNKSLEIIASRVQRKNLRRKADGQQRRSAAAT